MMKTLILSSLLLCCELPAVAQHDIYTLNARGEVVSDSAFIDPFFWKDQRTPYEQIYSETLPVQGFAKPYTIRLYNYENSEYDPGYFCIIEIEYGGRPCLRLAQSNAWDKFVIDYEYTDQYYRLVDLGQRTYALLFTGYHYASDPEQLTIVILREGEATLVFNRQRHITQWRDKASFEMTTMTRLPQDPPVKSSAPEYERIWQEGDILKSQQY